MANVSVWVPIIVAVIGLLGLVVTNVVTVISNNKREMARSVSQQKHEEKLNAAEHAHAERFRLIDQKQTAYSDLLRQVRVAAEASDRGSSEPRLEDGPSHITIYSTDLWSAASQAKLVSSPTGRTEIDEILTSFFHAYFRTATETESKLVDILANELDNARTI